jgi:hypothetical protein
MYCNMWVVTVSPPLFSYGSTAQASLSLLIVEVSRSHSDTLHSVGIFRTSYQPDAETSTWQHTTLTRDRYPRPGGIRTRNPSKRTTTARPLGSALCLSTMYKLTDSEVSDRPAGIRAKRCLCIFRNRARFVQSVANLLTELSLITSLMSIILVYVKYSSLRFQHF